jgi:nucleoside-diphosphate kinase
MERTLVLIKPDGVAKRVCGNIISRFERRGLTIAALKLLRVSPEQAARHYAEHQGKPFYRELIEFITSAPVVAMVLSGENAVAAVRAMMGPTNPLEAAPGTVRGDFGLSVGQNIIHGSDSIASAEREVGIFFAQEEIPAD